MPSHYMNQCWLVLIRLLEGNFSEIRIIFTPVSLKNACEIVVCKTAAIVSRGRWVKVKSLTCRGNGNSARKSENGDIDCPCQGHAILCNVSLPDSSHIKASLVPQEGCHRGICIQQTTYIICHNIFFKYLSIRQYGTKYRNQYADFRVTH